MVKIKGDQVAFPPICMCCAGPSTSTLIMGDSKTDGSSRRSAIWQLPSCKTCDAHRKADTDAAFAGTLGGAGALKYIIGPLLLGIVVGGIYLALVSARILKMSRSVAPAYAIILAAVVWLIVSLLTRPYIKVAKKQRWDDLKAGVAKLMTPTCVSPGPAVTYSWDGADGNSFHCLSKSFEDGMRQLNADRIVR